MANLAHHPPSALSEVCIPVRRVESPRDNPIGHRFGAWHAGEFRAQNSAGRRKPVIETHLNAAATARHGCIDRAQFFGRDAKWLLDENMPVVLKRLFHERGMQVSAG